MGPGSIFSRRFLPVWTGPYCYGSFSSVFPESLARDPVLCKALLFSASFSLKAGHDATEEGKIQCYSERKLDILGLTLVGARRHHERMASVTLHSEGTGTLVRCASVRLCTRC